MIVSIILFIFPGCLIVVYYSLLAVEPRTAGLPPSPSSPSQQQYDHLLLGEGPLPVACWLTVGWASVANRA